MHRYLFGPLTGFGLAVAAVACLLDQASKLYLLFVFDLADHPLRLPPGASAHVFAGSSLSDADVLLSAFADPDYPDVSPRDAKALREWETLRKAVE